jgi:hypothetical protein
MLVASARNECGTNRETANCGRIRVLTRSGGSVRNGGFLPLRPDGGVVTQRTANPLTVARFRDSSHNSPSVPPIAFQGLRDRSANRKSRSKPDRAETVIVEHYAKARNQAKLASAAILRWEGKRKDG